MQENIFYKNQGNQDVIKLIDKNDHLILDVGCGAGDNARIIKENHKDCKIYGVTFSSKESSYVKKIIDDCFVFDIETDYINKYTNLTFDCIIFSHVLEHVANPDKVLKNFLSAAKNDTKIIIAVPNILNWRYRLKFLFGEFNYSNEGVLDYTHLRFFTHKTATKILLRDLENLEISRTFSPGHFPLWILRKISALNFVWEYIDKFTSKLLPNLFGEQTIIVARVTNKYE